MKRKLWFLPVAICFILILGNRAEAYEYTGSIEIHTGMDRGEVALYFVGTMTEDGYLLEESYGGGFLKEEDVYSPALAQWLAESISGEGQYRGILPGEPVIYERVPQGLYLLVQSRTSKNDDSIAPCLIPLPYEGEWDIQLNLQSQSLPNTGQDMTPFLGFLGMMVSGAGLAICFRRKNETWV